MGRGGKTDSMKQYFFRLKNGRRLSLSLETTAQGWIILNRFVPDYLMPTYGNPLCGSMINSLDADEFELDCNKMIDCFHDTEYRNSQYCLMALKIIVRFHINQHGRVFIGDLITYTAEMCELMLAMGYSITTLKTLFPNFVRSCIDNYQDDVKCDMQDIYSYGSFVGPIPFSKTDRYRRLINMCPRLEKMPQI